MKPTDQDSPIRVGIGLIERNGSYLIRQRLDGQVMAGLWEFPGGKCEGEESSEAATVRECAEEVGLAVETVERVHQTLHRYPHGLVKLDYFRCRVVGSKTEPDADSGFRWVTAGDLPRYRFPEANEALIAVLARRGVEPTDSPRDEP